MSDVLETITQDRLEHIFKMLIECRDIAEDFGEDDLRDRIDDELDTLETDYPHLEGVEP